jgi:hypothetical protein
MPTAANVGAAQAVTEIELNLPPSSTTITTAQLPVRAIAFAPSGETTFTVNLPTPDIRQSGLTFSVKTELEEESGVAFITVVHNSVNLLTATELDEAEGSIDFLWDGYAWTYSSAYLLRSFPNRVLQLPGGSGTLALEQPADNVFRIVGSADASKKVAFEVDGLSTGTTRTLTVPDANITIENTGHAAKHHTGGTDALTPFSIGADSRFVTTSLTVFASQTLAAGRAQIYILNVLSAATVTLPTTGVEIGDRLVIVGGSPVSATATLSSTGISDALTSQNQQFSYVYGNVGGSIRWIKNLVDVHTHAAADITSGTLDVARLPVGTGSTNVIAPTIADAKGDLIVASAADTVARLAVGGTNGHVLTVDSAETLGLKYAALPAGGTKTYATFTATDNQPTATAFATLDTRNSIAVLDFDDATDESAVFVSIIPEAASLGSGLKIRLHWMATTATSGNVVWDVSLERMTTDLDSDSFDTIASGTAAANGTSGILTVTEITLTTIDSVTAGDGYRLKVTRDANNASDTMTGDAELVVCEVRSAA